MNQSEFEILLNGREIKPEECLNLCIVKNGQANNIAVTIASNLQEIFEKDNSALIGRIKEILEN